MTTETERWLCVCPEFCLVTNEESPVPISSSLISPWVWGSTRLETTFTYKSGLNPAGQVTRSLKIELFWLVLRLLSGNWPGLHLKIWPHYRENYSSNNQHWMQTGKKKKLVEKSEVDRNHWLAKYSEWNVSLYEINDSRLLWAVLIFIHFVGFQDIESTPTIYSCLPCLDHFFFFHSE